MKMTITSTFFALVLLCAATAHADIFGTSTNQFTLNFVPISGSTNPTVAQTNTVYLHGFGIVNNNYRMGVHEITNTQWNKFKASVGGTVTGSESLAYNEDFFDYGTGTTDVPTNEVSWYEAAQFVNWLNTSSGHQAAYNFTGTIGTSNYTFAKWTAVEAAGGTNLYRHKDAHYFMPTEDEWIKAAFWNGTNIQDHATKASDSLAQGDGTSGSGWNYSINGSTTNPSGSWDVGSGSEELNGTYDMMGNNREWIESPYNDPTYAVGSWRGECGGAWVSVDTGHLSPSNRSSSPPTSEDGFTGFRVASVPEPSSIALLVSGLGTLLLRRRRRK